jgi:hypothetical protein
VDASPFGVDFQIRIDPFFWPQVWGDEFVKVTSLHRLQDFGPHKSPVDLRNPEFAWKFAKLVVNVLI